MSRPVDPLEARRHKRDHPETAEERRCRWMRFVAQRENKGIAAFVARHAESGAAPLPLSPPTSDITDGRPAAATAAEVATLLHAADMMEALDTPTDPAVVRNAFKRQQLDKARLLKLGQLKSELSRITKKVDPKKGFFWASYPDDARVSLVPSRIQRTMPAGLGQASANQKRKDAQWQIHSECTLPARQPPKMLDL
jgi:hypothetical protein